MLGQKTLKNTLKYMYDKGKLPKTLIFQAGVGMGKTELAKWLAQQAGLMFYHVTEMRIGAIRDVINHALTASQPTLFYLESGDDLTTQAQNALLKLTEEPPKRAYIILGVRNQENLLPTLLSRVIAVRFEPYTKQELDQFAGSLGFTPEDWLLQISRSPGELFNYQQDPYIEVLKAKAQTAVNHIGQASLQNVFTLTSKVEPDYEYAFTGLLLHYFGVKLMESSTLNDIQYVLKGSEQVIETRRLMTRTYANKKNLLDRMLERLWRLYREWILIG